MNRRGVVVAICLVILIVVLIVVLPGRATGRPSSADVEEAVLEYIAGLKSTAIIGILPPYQWVDRVEVIEYGTPYNVRTITGDYRYWPVRVYLIDDQGKEEKQVEVYGDEFGKWAAIMPEEFPT